MSLTGVRPYIRDVLIEQGFEEWPEAFIASAIPDTLVDRVFHMEPGPSTLTSTTQGNIAFYNSVQTLRIFRRGFEQSNIAVDDILADGESITAALVDITRRTNTITDVKVTSLSPVRLAASSDNAVTLEMVVEMRVFVCPDNAPTPTEEI